MEKSKIFTNRFNDQIKIICLPIDGKYIILKFSNIDIVKTVNLKSNHQINKLKDFLSKSFLDNKVESIINFIKTVNKNGTVK